MLSVPNCTHGFCTECITKYIIVELQKTRANTKTLENARTFRCLGLDCNGVLGIDACTKMIPKDVLSNWEDAILESMIDYSQRYYCPYKDCSRLMGNINCIDPKAPVNKKCRFCYRLFCSECRVPWHSGFRCEEFLELNEDERQYEDIMMLELARKKYWRRCPRCTFFVEKIDGCRHVICRCGCEFCYTCGARWSIHPSGSS